MTQSLSASLAGVSAANEFLCDCWFKDGDRLRAAVGWRYFSGKGEALSAGTGVPLDKIKLYIETGKLSKKNRTLLELSR